MSDKDKEHPMSDKMHFFSGLILKYFSRLGSAQLIPGRDVENGDNRNSENKTLEKLKSSFAEAMSSTIVQMTTKSKEDMKSMMYCAMTVFSDSSKSVAVDVNNILTDIEKLRTENESLRVKQENAPTQQQKKGRKK